MLIVYVACVVISILLCAWYYVVDVRRSSVQNLMLIAMVVTSIGYLSLALQSDLSGALLSQKIIYLGAVYLAVLYFFSICEFCNFQIKTWVSVVLVAIQSLVFVLVCTTGHSDIYYKSVDFYRIGGVGVLVKEYGLFHAVFPVSIIGFFMVSLVIAIYTSRKQKNVNRLGLIVMIGCLGICVFSYIFQRIIHTTYDYAPIIYLILITGALLPIYQADIYTVVENEEIIKEQLGKYGFVTFDSKLNYMGANECALNIFPELKSVYLGRQLSDPSVEMLFLINLVEKYLNDKDNEKEKYHISGVGVQIGEKNYETIIHTLRNFRGKRVGAAVELSDVTDHVRMLELTEKYNDELAADVEKKTRKIRAIQENTILGMAQMVESRDLSTGGHIKRTSAVVRIFSNKLLEENMGFDKHFLDLVIRSAPMHDIGKIGVDDAVLRKQSKFTDEEYEKMKKHSEIGGRLIKEILSGVEEEEFVTVAFNVANYHHEKVNGRGYPSGIKGDEIPVEARIMALADVFDALVSKRCYKEAFSYDEAFGIIEKDAGEHFDKKLAEVFLSCRSELEEYYNNTNIES